MLLVVFVLLSLRQIIMFEAKLINIFLQLIHSINKDFEHVIDFCIDLKLLKFYFKQKNIEYNCNIIIESLFLGYLDFKK